MSLANDFLLERVVHHVLKANNRGGREALLGAGGGVNMAARPAPTLLAEVVWPTMECVEALRTDGLISRRTYNGAIRTLRGLLELVERRLPKELPNGRSMLVLTAAGERGDLGADILATLAEAQGWMVFFAGVGLTHEEILYSLRQLGPDVLLLQGTSAESARQLGRLHAAMQQGGLRPAVQIAAAGAFARNSASPWGADLAATGPTEILELLALWPEHRRATPSGAGLRFDRALAGGIVLDPATIRRMILRHVQSGDQDLN